MAERSIRRFLLRHRLPVVGALVGLVLVILAVWTFVIQEPAGDDTEPIALRGQVLLPGAEPEGPRETMPPTTSPERKAPSRPPEPVAPPRPPRAAAARETGPAPAGVKPLAEILGPLGGVAGPHESTAILGVGPLELEGDRLRWTVHVIENGITHVAVGLPLEPLGGAGILWMAGEAPGSGTPPYRVDGILDLEPSLGAALRRATGPVRVRVAGFRIGGRGRLQVVSEFAEVPLRSGSP